MLAHTMKITAQSEQLAKECCTGLNSIVIVDLYAVSLKQLIASEKNRF